ncbi:MAG: RNA-guided endonuclease InsQ/TnpB family protein, partial [Microcystaceae cyanobacterium]
ECPTKIYFKDDDARMSYGLRTIKHPNYAQLCKDFRENNHYQGIGGQQGQQTIKSVIEVIHSYNALLKAWFNGEIKEIPKIPNYRKRGLYQVTFTNQNIRYEELEGACYLPLAKSQKPEMENPLLVIPSGFGFNANQIAEVRIVPQNGKLWAEYVYKTEPLKSANLDYSEALGIDHGLNNWLTCVSTQGKSLIINGRKVKSINQRSNRFVAKHKQGKDQTYWDEELDQATHQRNCHKRDAVNKAARFIINYCLNHGIGNIVFGWNDRQKDSIKMGKRNNQNFVQIPTARLKNRIQQLAETYGIKFIETEEAYTSKASFLDHDLVPRHGEKPSQYEFSGQRIKRGLYQDSKGQLINADANGAANILRKVATQVGINLSKVGKGLLTVPKRYFLTNLSKSYRKRAQTCLQTVGA